MSRHRLVGQARFNGLVVGYLWRFGQVKAKPSDMQGVQESLLIRPTLPPDQVKPHQENRTLANLNSALFAVHYLCCESKVLLEISLVGDFDIPILVDSKLIICFSI